MGTGGARFGAGRPGYKVKAGQVLSLDVCKLARLGYTKRNCSFGWQWEHDGKPTASINITVQAGIALTLNYTATLQGQVHDYALPINLTHTACHFGQSRTWALCPCCGRRVAKLYLRAGQFACRHCQRVAYISQSLGALGRSWIKQRKIESRLGDNWQRPKGMRQATHDRLMIRLIDCHKQREAALAAFLMRLGDSLRRLNL
jgi:hypothetical protein